MGLTRVMMVGCPFGGTPVKHLQEQCDSGKLIYRGYQNEGTLLGAPNDKGYSVLGGYIKVPLFRKTTIWGSMIALQVLCRE